MNKSKWLINHIRGKLLETDQNILDFGKLRNNFSQYPVTRYMFFIHISEKEKLYQSSAITSAMGFLFRSERFVSLVFFAMKLRNGNWKQIVLLQALMYQKIQNFFCYVGNAIFSENFGFSIT